MILNTKWKLAADPENRGREQRWFDAVAPNAEDAPVPGIIQQVFPDYHGVAWYWTTFTLDPPAADQRVLLRFGAVDYLAEAWVNGVAVGGHEGGETPFTLDVTAAARLGANRLAIRVLNPTDRPIDGITLEETPHRNKRPRGVFPGSTFNYGGILLPVAVQLAPAVRVTDVFARPRSTTGLIDCTVAVQNDTPNVVTGAVLATAGPVRSGETLAQVTRKATFPPGQSVHELRLTISQPRLWSLEDPFLYCVRSSLSADGVTHDCAVRCGFREFCVTDGYFHLNGKRLFLKSSHTGNHFPISQVAPTTSDFMYRDLLYAKALGFNTVRFIAGVAWPEQLDLCDEIGLMVYEEHLAGWLLADSAKMAERYDRSTREMIVRDRNHPCITIWGMLNETQNGPVFRHAVEALQLVRELDDTRLVLLASGRWDCQPSIGSVSNPGSRVWEHQWGIEAPGRPPVSNAWNHVHGGYFDRAGDAHVYPPTPLPEPTYAFLRTLGRGMKPVFLSEFGTGSQFNAMDEARKYAEAGARPELPDYAFIRSMLERLQRDWARWRMDDAYPCQEDFFRDSYRLSVRQRRLNFDLVRSNPRLCGYNVTGLLDHGITGEGLWTFWREFKPGMADALRDGWAPLRWCLFATPAHAYSGTPIHLEAVLANEDVLPSGKYSVSFRLIGPKGTSWEKHTRAVVPHPKRGLPPLAIPVLSETVRVDGPSGLYTFAASMDGAAPLGDRLSVHLTSENDLRRSTGAVTVWGLDTSVRRRLASWGVRCRPFAPGSAVQREVILVGLPPRRESTSARWHELAARAARGSTVLFLCQQAFAKGNETVHWLPLKQLTCKRFHDWLYHKECVARRHPVFTGLQAPGVLDWDYYGPLISHDMFQGEVQPEDVIVAAFTVGYCVAEGYDAGIMLGAYRFGKGRLLLNTLHILEQLGAHPAADRLLANLIAYAQRDRQRASAPAGL